MLHVANYLALILYHGLSLWRRADVDFHKWTWEWIPSLIFTCRYTPRLSIGRRCCCLFFLPTLLAFHCLEKKEKRKSARVVVPVCVWASLKVESRLRVAFSWQLGVCRPTQTGAPFSLALPTITTRSPYTHTYYTIARWRQRRPCRPWK